jgi:uncharacterized membrane protein
LGAGGRAAGLATTGLVGIFESYVAMSKIGRGGSEMILLIIILYIILPAVLTYLISIFMRKKGYIKNGDLKIKI